MFMEIRKGKGKVKEGGKINKRKYTGDLQRERGMEREIGMIYENVN